ncbi:sensor domain-containing diguanylate cyclase [Virgibacillus salexigens]|nr:sensor domain-containing diguanylate cyclase [Virgibacillus massiliensis]
MMMNSQVVKRELQQYYFDVITNWDCRSYEEFVSLIAIQINRLPCIQLTGMYKWMKESSTYHLISTDLVSKELLEEGLNSKDISKDLFCFYSYEKDYYLNVTSGLLLYVRFSDINSISILQTIQSETRKVLKLAQQMMSNQDIYPFLYEFSISVFTMTHKSEILKEVYRTIQTFYPDNVIQFLLSHDTELDDDIPIQTIAYTDDETKSYSYKAFVTGGVQLENVDKDSRKIYAPLTGKQGVYGVIQLLLKDSPGMLLERQISCITHIAHTAGMAIENVSLLETSNHLISDLKLINDVTHKVNSNLDLTDITESVRDKIEEVCQASEIGFIFRHSENRVDILSASTSYFKSKNSEAFTAFLFKEIDYPVFKGDYDEYPHLPYRSLMVIPMRQEYEVYGFVVIMHESPYYFTFEVYKLLQSLIQHCSLALSNAILKEELQRAVITDYLTNLYSRNHLEEVIIKEMKVAEKGSLILFDIDDFKKINDEHGHPIGDEVLKQVANIIIDYSKQAFVPSRWGGEELAIYAPNTSINEAVQIADKICGKVKTSTSPSVTLSCGVSFWTRTINDSVSELFIRADKALYEAKNTGKNSVVKNVKLK